MITLDQFASKYNGKYLDWDHAYGYQCPDLVRYYQKEVLGVPPEAIPAALTALQIFNNFRDNQYFTKVINTPYNVPTKGSVVFWGYPMGFYWDGWKPKWAGHMAVYSNGNVKKFISFDQNFPTGSFCRYFNHDYKGVVGWLTPKV